MFSDEFLEHIPDNPVEGLDLLIKKFQEWESANRFKMKKYPDFNGHYPEMLKAYAVLQAYSEAHDLKIVFPDLNVSNKEENVINISKAFNHYAKNKLHQLKMVQEKLDFQLIKDEYAQKFGRSFAYQFSDGDLRKTQNLLRLLGHIVSRSDYLDENHKNRLMNRLQRSLQILHKKSVNLDPIWGLIGDAGVVISRYGSQADSIANRIFEIIEIIWRTQAITENLESGINNPFLGD